MLYDQPLALRPSKFDQISNLLLDHVRGTANITEQARGGEGNSSDEAPLYQMCGHVAVVNIHGVIGKRLDWLSMMCGGCCVDQVKQALMEAEADPMTRAIVLDIDSPGGTITGVPELGAFIEALSARLPVVAYTETQMCSAGYWIGCAAGEIVCSPSASVGSVGVIIALLDDSEKWRAEGYKPRVYKTGELKDMGNRGVEWRESWDEFLQERVDSNGELFFNHVRKNRPDIADEVFETAGWWSGAKLGQLGLVDYFADSVEGLVVSLNQNFDS